MKTINVVEFLADIGDHLKIEKKPFILGIAGGSGSGKSYISKRILEHVEGKILSVDDYYKNGSEGCNFDVPRQLDLELLREHLEMLQKGETIKKPIYDFKTHSRIGEEDFKVEGVIILEGLFALNNLFIDILDFRIFVEAPEEVRLERRMKRDVLERGRTGESVLKQWKETVEPNFVKHILPQKEIADLLILNS